MSKAIGKLQDELNAALEDINASLLIIEAKRNHLIEGLAWSDTEKAIKLSCELVQRLQDEYVPAVKVLSIIERLIDTKDYLRGGCEFFDFRSFNKMAYEGCK